MSWNRLFLGASLTAVGVFAVPTGIGVFRALTVVMSPDIYQPNNGNVLYVFELPNGQ